jgi:serine/threonine protein kinase
MQITEAVCYIHSEGVLHCDLRPANCLLDINLDLMLCDFGGSRFGALSGKGLPDSGFYDPSEKGPPSVAMEIFGLGSLLYVIMTGQLPHYSSVQRGGAEDYNTVVTRLFSQRRFPDVKHIKNGRTILGCWEGKLITASGV